MGRRGEITDAAWEQIEPLLPENGRRGGRWRDHRTVKDDILWKLRTGAPWRDLPERYGAVARLELPFPQEIAPAARTISSDLSVEIRSVASTASTIRSRLILGAAPSARAACSGR
jgi:hypothetical protein